MPLVNPLRSKGHELMKWIVVIWERRFPTSERSATTTRRTYARCCIGTKFNRATGHNAREVKNLSRECRRRELQYKRCRSSFTSRNNVRLEKTTIFSKCEMGDHFERLDEVS